MSNAVGYIPPTIPTSSASASMADAELPPESEEEMRREERDRENRKTTIIHSVVASISMLSSLTAMYIHSSFITVAQNIFPLFTAPYAVRQRRQLNKMPSLREEHNVLRLEVNRLSVQNDILSTHNDRLAKEVARLKHVEEQLHEIMLKQGQQVDKFVGLVKDNHRIQEEIEDLLDAEVFQDLLQAILESDHNSDFKIGDSELNMVLVRLRNFPRIKVNENELRSRFASSESKSVSALLDVTKSLMKEEKEKAGSDAKLLDMDMKKSMMKGKERVGSDAVFV